MQGRYPLVNGGLNLTLPRGSFMCWSQTTTKIQQLTYQTNLNTSSREQRLKEGFELCESHRDNI